MKEITTVEVKKRLLDNKNISIIDVREPFEVAEGKIPSSINIPLGEIEARLQEIDMLLPHIIVCRSGARSAQATLFLQFLGYDVTNMVGGMMLWEESVSLK
ncbi:rhodanese-like domain-containing protein [Evansella sp. AB-rgal1]|uniref:rhodanese-like domain-containing protein n=1 Tax=Evansella sp. AB-rgal1 TaxID=3242696 RepID=UPI00359ECC59